MSQLLEECESALKSETEGNTDEHITEEFSCDLSGKTYTNGDEFMIDKKSHLDIFKCDLCGKTFNRKDTLQRHSKTHCEKKIKCYLDLCRKEFTNLDEKYLYIEEAHGIIPKKYNIYSPDFKIDAVKKIKEIGLIKASKELNMSESTLSNWQRVIFKPLYCSFCGKAFAGEGELKHHEERVHLKIDKNTEKPKQEKEKHQCDKCSKLFNCSSHLKCRMYNCSGYKAKNKSSSTLYCEICQITFSKRNGLAEHIRFVHEKEKNFCCEFCTKTFARRNTLTQHIMDVHEQSGKFACGYCDKKYFKERDKIVHERKHTGVKPYQCENCGESCSTYKAKKTEYRCEKCNAALLPVLLQQVTKAKSVESEDKDENHDQDINKLPDMDVIPTQTNLRELYKQKYVTDERVIPKDGEDNVEAEMKYIKEKEMMIIHDQLAQNVKEETFDEEVINDNLVQNDKGTNIEEIIDKNGFVQIMKEANDEIIVKKVNESDMVEESHFVKKFKESSSEVIIDYNQLAKDVKESNANNMIHDNQLIENEIDEDHSEHGEKSTIKKNYNHILINSYREHQCNICQKNFLRRNGLVEHVRFIHEKERNFCCEICNKTFARKNAMTAHIKDVHEKNGSFMCGFCDKKFFREQDKTTHERKHTGEKPYQCENCGDSFNRKGSLTTHKKSHLGVKEHQCFDCGKQFGTKGSLQRHVYTANPNELPCKTRSKEYQCFDCGKQFVTDRSLKHHVYSVHLNNFPCNTCDNRINSMLHLKEHMKKYSLSLKQEKQQI